MIDKFTIFREMLDYMAQICNVTDADMNYIHDMMKITGETDKQYICLEVTIKSEEENIDA